MIEKEGHHVVIGISSVDEQMKLEREYREHLLEELGDNDLLAAHKRFHLQLPTSPPALGMLRRAAAGVTVPLSACGSLRLTCSVSVSPPSAAVLLMP